MTPSATASGGGKSGHRQTARPPSPVDAPRAQTLLVVIAVLAALGVSVHEPRGPVTEKTHLSKIASPAPIRIDLNLATYRELNLLPGIGEKMAAKLIRRRDQLQGFVDWQSIESVPGMGPATVREMQQWCSLGPTHTTADTVFLASRNH